MAVVDNNMFVFYRFNLFFEEIFHRQGDDLQSGAQIADYQCFIAKIALTRFTRTLHSLLKSGIPIIKALEITAEGIGNALYKKIILEMTEQEVSRGVSFGMAMKGGRRISRD